MSTMTDSKFTFTVEDIYKIGGIGWVIVGNVKSGVVELDADEICEFKVKRTGTILRSTTSSAMHRPTERRFYEVGSSFGTGIKMSKTDIVVGDELVLVSKSNNTVTKPRVF